MVVSTYQPTNVVGLEIGNSGKLNYVKRFSCYTNIDTRRVGVDKKSTPTIIAQHTVIGYMYFRLYSLTLAYS